MEGCVFASMEHKGVKYTVVQTAAPTGWRWTVELALPRKNRTGQAHSREAAVKRALALIDSLPPSKSVAPQTAGTKAPSDT